MNRQQFQGGIEIVNTFLTMHLYICNKSNQFSLAQTVDFTLNLTDTATAFLKRRADIYT